MKNEIIYWIPIRTMAATEKDKWHECSKCGNTVNRAELSNQDLEKYFYKCYECGSEMNIDITMGLIKSHLAKGDRRLDEVIKELIGRTNK